MFQTWSMRRYTFGVRKPCLRSGRKHGLRTPKRLLSQAAIHLRRDAPHHTVEGVRMATTAQPVRRTINAQNIGRWIVGGLLGLVLAALLFRIVRQAVQNPTLLAQQLLTGILKGAILAII